MRTLCVVVALLAGCGAPPNVDYVPLTLCQLSVGATVIARGTLQGRQGNTATLHVLEALKGASQDVTFSTLGDRTRLPAAIATGAPVFLFTTTTLSGTWDVNAQGLFWQGVGGDLGNGWVYEPTLGVFEDGGTVARGGVSEAELRAQVTASAGFTKMEQCYSP